MESCESVFLSLGSNLGDRNAALQEALAGLSRGSVSIAGCSFLYETEPVGLKQQPDFLNMVCRVRTSLSPSELLQLCKSVEQGLGRRPTVVDGPRLIDIDILLFGRQIVDFPHLKIPHPAYHLRRFVLVPLAELAPELRDPRDGRSVLELLAACPDRSWVRRLGRVELTSPSSL